MSEPTKRQKSAHGAMHHRVECECDVCYPLQVVGVSSEEDTGELMEQFNNLIALAKIGENGKGAISILREICREAADKAPPHDLIKMAQLLYDIRTKGSVTP